MARAYFGCAGCGAQTTVWGRNRRDADDKAAWYQKQWHLCDACRAAGRAAENEAAATDNAERGLPALTGSPKQVAWAETIRSKAVTEIEQAAGSLLAMLAADVVKTLGEGRDIELGELRDAATLLIVERRDETSASWWIDHSHTDWTVDIRQDLRKRLPALAPTATAAMTAAARNSARVA